MKSCVVPEWPNLGESCLTPGGFGREGGSKPCFCTRYNSYSVYVPHSLTRLTEEARVICKKSLPSLVWPFPDNRVIRDVEIGGEKRNLFLEIAFSHVLVRELV